MSFQYGGNSQTGEPTLSQSGGFSVRKPERKINKSTSIVISIVLIVASLGVIIKTNIDWYYIDKDLKSMLRHMDNVLWQERRNSSNTMWEYDHPEFEGSFMHGK